MFGDILSDLFGVTRFIRTVRAQLPSTSKASASLYVTQWRFCTRYCRQRLGQSDWYMLLSVAMML